MSVPNLEGIREQAISCGLDACWQQWAQLGAPVDAATSPTAAIVDPEALLLLTLELHEHERRLLDLAAWWAQVGSRHTSLQRLRTLAEAFPRATATRLPWFAQVAHDAGDRRFSRLARAADGSMRARRKSEAPPRLDARPALMVRLRAGFGLGVKPDVLTVLLGHGGKALPARTLLAATAYSEPSLREGAHDLVVAGFARATTERPIRFSADPSAWSEVLATRVSAGDPGTGAASFAPWRFWTPVFAFLAGAATRCTELSAEGAGPYPAASSLRSLFDAHRQAFELNDIDVPDPERYEGSAFLEGFAQIVSRLATWVQANS